MKTPYISFLLLLSLLLAAPLWAATDTGTGSSAPIRIEADRMVSQEMDNSVLFSGHVDARQGDVIIRSDEMTVYYHEGAKAGNGKKKSQKLKKLVCKGNVQITRGDWLGTGRRMDYFADERKVILSGDAKAWQEDNMVAGETIVYYLDEKRSIVEAGKKNGGRVQSVIRPD